VGGAQRPAVLQPRVHGCAHCHVQGGAGVSAFNVHFLNTNAACFVADRVVEVLLVLFCALGQHCRTALDYGGLTQFLTTQDVDAKAEVRL